MPANSKPKKDSARLGWDTKPQRAPNPRGIKFQTAEVVFPNWQRDNDQLPLVFREGNLADQELDKSRMNRLIWGDKILAMQALLAHGYEGKINFIYIDPPFDSRADYFHLMTIEGTAVTKWPSVIKPHKTPDSCLVMERQPEGRKLGLVFKDAPGSCRGSITERLGSSE